MQKIEHDFVKKIPKKNFILTDFCNTENVIEEIFKIIENKERVYLFSSGTKANFLYERSCVNDLSFNCFQIYNENVFFAFKKIKKMLNEICLLCNLDIEKNKYYLTSELNVEFLENCTYDLGGMRIPVFGGYWILECQNDSNIFIEDKKIDVSEGTIILSEVGKKINFKGINKAISFNISTLNKIKNQYPQKWMPI